MQKEIDCLEGEMKLNGFVVNVVGGFIQVDIERALI